MSGEDVEAAKLKGGANDDWKLTHFLVHEKLNTAESAKLGVDGRGRRLINRRTCRRTCADFIIASAIFFVEKMREKIPNDHSGKSRASSKQKCVRF